MASADPAELPIVVAGEALVDLALGETDELHGHPGGGPYNLARTVARLGRPAAYLGRISSDRFGRRLRRELEADGVRLDAVVETDDPTTLALAELDAAGTATYRFYTEGTSVPGLTLEQARAALPDPVGMLCVGTLGLVLEPMASALEGLLGEMPGDVLVMLDPNCRPQVIEDPAAYRERIARVLARTAVVKASEEDLAFLVPGRDPADAARELLAHGPALVLVTRGGEGALVVTGGETRAVPAPKVQVIDTIGAGDAFGGAFLAWWHRHGHGPGELADLDRAERAASFAALVAARTCERAGASPPHATELPDGAW